VVEARINGEKGERMVVDSAADVVLIAAKAAKKLGLQRLAPGEYRGVGLAAGVPSDWVLLKELVVGPLHFKNVPALLMDEKPSTGRRRAGSSPSGCSVTTACITTAATAS